MHHKGVLNADDMHNLWIIADRIFKRRGNNVEPVHWKTGTARIVMYMTEQHFIDCSDTSYYDHTRNEVEDKYEFVEHIVVWAYEVDHNEIDIILRIMRTGSIAVSAIIPQTFELARTGNGDDFSPQMFHFDGKGSNVAGVSPVSQIGTPAVRESTEFVEHEHQDPNTLEPEAKETYLRSVFDRITRKTGTTTAQFDRLEQQNQLKEELTGDNKLVNYTCEPGDLVTFFTNHLHRGPASRGVGYAVFFAWVTQATQNESDDNDPHTDSTPIHFTNWEDQYGFKPK